MNKSLIEIKNISKDFEVAGIKNRVLHNINLEISAGKLTMLVGQSGCGKTTLLSIITSILQPSEGEIIINNVHITKLKDKDKTNFRRKNLGFIFQQYNLLPALTAIENAAIPLIADGIKIKPALEIASQILINIDMKEHLNKLPNQLSGGQQQRVAIARSLVHDPKVIVCDEPTAALDATTGYKVMEILQKHSKANDRAVIVVTHDDRIFKFADKIIKMEDGKIITND